MTVFILASLAACSAAETAASLEPTEEKLTVAVGIAPHASFVEAVAGDLAKVVTMVPPGDNPETFQPTMTQMQALSDAAVYFSQDLPTEEASILPKLPDFNQDIVVVDLFAAVAKEYPLLPSAHSHGHDDDDDEEFSHKEEYDHHLWLSPKRAAAMVQTIVDTLCGLNEANAEIFRANAKRYIAELEELDAELKTTLSSLGNKSFIIYHSAYAYFADDYGLEMIGIEIEGKQATAAELKKVIALARQLGIKTVFYQQEFDGNQARTIAEEISGTAMQAAPLSPDYTGALRKFAAALTGQAENE